MRRAAVFLLIWCLAARAAAAAEQPPQAGALPRVFVLDAKVLAASRARLAAGDKELASAADGLRKRAESALRTGPLAVTDKKIVPPSGDKHDYFSLAPYWWPDPSKPDGKPYIRRDGEVHQDRGLYDNTAMDRMAAAAETLAQAWYFTGREEYAQHAARLLRAWFLDEKTRMNPNLNFGQAVPGVTDGRAAGVIDTTDLIGLVDAVGLLGGSRAWTEADQRGLQAWFQKYLAWLRESKIGRDEAAASNNHGTWYDAQAASYALFAGRADLAREALERARGRIAKQIEPDGRQPKELARTKSWDYSTMNLRGWFTLAVLGERVGVDLWQHRTADGRSIRAALDYLLPFALAPEKWREKQIVRFRPHLLAPALRLAAVKYGSKEYEESARRIAGDEQADWRDRLLGLRP